MTFLQPSRVDVDRIRDLLAGVTDPRVGWRLLVERGALAERWLDDPLRRFVHEPADPTGHRPTRDPALAPALAYPSSIETCVLVAADAAGVEAAERAARILVDRLEPWGAPAFHHALWWSLPRTRYDDASSDTRPGVSYALMFAANALCDVMSDRRSLSAGPFGRAEAWAAVWRERASAGARVGNDSTPAAVCGRAFADLPNPFEPLSAIEALGYASLEWVVANGASNGAAILVMPLP